MKRNLIAITLCLLALLVLPARAEAAEAPGMEILAPTEVQAGETVTVTVALKDYDVSQDAILGMQVDVEYPESLTPVSQISHLSDNARSNLTLVHPEEKLVRLLYIQETQTLPSGTREIFSAEFQTVQDFQTVTLPVTVRVQMESGERFTIYDDCTIQEETTSVKILAQPENAEVALGEDFCVTVEAEGENLKYQWYFKNAGSDQWYKSGVRDNTYDDEMTKVRAGREIYCVITDAHGNSVTTETAKLIRVPKEELKILTQPVNDEAAMGEDFCVTVEAQGEDLKYQWYFKNAGSDQWYKSGVRDNTYDDEMTKVRAGREIYCVITDALGNSVTTETAKLIRVPKEELKILVQPVSDEAAMGEDFCVTVEAQGEDLKYQWYFKNAGSDQWYKSGVRDNTYDDEMTKARAGREIYCVITDAFGNTVTTETANLIRIPKEELKILTQPENIEAAMGEDFCVTVKAQGEDLKYQWYFKNAGTDQWYQSGVRDNTYDDVMTKARANRDVYCVITDALGNQVQTDVATLVLKK